MERGVGKQKVDNLAPNRLEILVLYIELLFGANPEPPDMPFNDSPPSVPSEHTEQPANTSARICGGFHRLEAIRLAQNQSPTERRNHLAAKHRLPPVLAATVPVLAATTPVLDTCPKRSPALAPLPASVCPRILSGVSPQQTDVASDNEAWAVNCALVAGHLSIPSTPPSPHLSLPPCLPASSPPPPPGASSSSLPHPCDTTGNKAAADGDRSLGVGTGPWALDTPHSPIPSAVIPIRWHTGVVLLVCAGDAAPVTDARSLSRLPFVASLCRWAAVITVAGCAIVMSVYSRNASRLYRPSAVVTRVCYAVATPVWYAVVMSGSYAALMPVYAAILTPVWYAVVMPVNATDVMPVRYAVVMPVWCAVPL
ncbi:hypothetical protein FRC06_005643 [Ceratobasidium sp. 370]|nr:hypothetical protein FRC06_005643 [Ceratobasidium sp. 370]